MKIDLTTCINDQLKWRFLALTVRLPNYGSLFSLCKHNCLDKLIIYINRDKFFYKSKNITNEQVDLIKWNLFWFCVAKINKQLTRHARKSEYRGKLNKAYKAFRSQKCKAFRSRKVSFRPQNVSFRSVLEADRFVQTIQRSCGVVVRFRVCILLETVSRLSYLPMGLFFSFFAFMSHLCKATFLFPHSPIHY